MNANGAAAVKTPGPRQQETRFLMRRKTLAAVMVGAALLLGAARAQAAPFTPGLNLAYRVALHYWGHPPVNCTSVAREIVPNGTLGESEGRMNTGLATIPAAPEPCFLRVAKMWAKPSLFVGACMMVTHEVGHLEGLGHSTDPLSVMYPVPTNPPAICEREGYRIGRWPVP